MKEVEISIKGLLFYILRHWKSIVVSMLLGACILCGLQVFEDARESRTDLVVVEPGAMLTDSEKAYVEAVYHYTMDLKQVNERQSELLIVRIDAQNLYKEDLTYIIKAEDSEYIEGIEQAYRNLIVGSDCIEYISEKTGISSSDIYDTVTLCDPLEGSYTTKTKNISIHIVSDEKANVESISDAMNSFLNNKRKDLQLYGLEYELIVVDDSIYFGDDAQTMTAQTKLLQEQQTRAKTILDVENSLKGSMKEYYDSLSTAPGDKEDYSSHEINDKTYSRPQIRLSAKNIILGLIAGMFFMCGVYFLIYVFANRLAEEDDVERLYGLYLIGIVSGKDYGTFLYRLKHFGKRTFDFDESVRLICTRIKMAVQKEGVHKLGLAGCAMKKNNKYATDAILTFLKTEGIETVLVDDPLYDSTGTDALLSVERVILLEKAGVTYRNEIWKEIEMIKQIGIKIEGIVIAE